MSYALTQAIWVSISSLFFVTVHLVFGRKIAARPLYILGLILAISFILPVKLPLLRMEIPESTALEAVFSAESVELPALPDNTANGTDTIYPGVSAPQVPTANEKESVFPTETVVLAIYLAGVFATLFCTFYRYCRAVKTLQRCGRAPTEREKRIFTELCRKQGVSRMPRLLVCPESAIGSSVMFGFIKQTVLIADGLKEEDLALILGHELTHCKRKDPIMKAFLAFLGAIYWFNPAVFLFNRTMHRLCEESCDETLLRGSSQESKIQYCRLLVAAASARNAKNKALMTSFKGGKIQMKRRLNNILTEKSKKLTALIICATLALVMVSSVVYAVVVPKFPNENNSDIGTIGIIAPLTDSELQKIEDEIRTARGEANNKFTDEENEIIIEQSTKHSIENKTNGYVKNGKYKDIASMLTKDG